MHAHRLCIAVRLEARHGEAAAFRIVAQPLGQIAAALDLCDHAGTGHVEQRDIAVVRNTSGKQRRVEWDGVGEGRHFCTLGVGPGKGEQDALGRDFPLGRSTAERQAGSVEGQPFGQSGTVGQRGDDRSGHIKPIGGELEIALVHFADTEAVKNRRPNEMAVGQLFVVEGNTAMEDVAIGRVLDPYVDAHFAGLVERTCEGHAGRIEADAIGQAAAVGAACFDREVGRQKAIGNDAEHARPFEEQDVAFGFDIIAECLGGDHELGAILKA